jgi:hypothetical protein
MLLEWREAKQSFVITKTYKDTYTLDGSYKLFRGSLQDTYKNIVDSDQTNVDMEGSMTISGTNMSYIVTVTVNGIPSRVTGGGSFIDYGYYLAISGGDKIIVLDRGTWLVISRLYYLSGTGYVNEVEYWKKNL